MTHVFDALEQYGSVGIIRNAQIIKTRGPRLRIYRANLPFDFVDFYLKGAHQTIYDYIAHHEKFTHFVITFATDEEIFKADDQYFLLTTWFAERVCECQIIEQISIPGTVCFVCTERLTSFCIDRFVQFTMHDVSKIWNKMMVRINCEKFL